MFEGIIFIIFLIIGGITALLVLFFFVIAAVRRSKRMLKIGLAIAIIPLSLYALIYWFYDIHIPKLNKQAEKVYAGTYVMISPNTSGNTNAGYTQPTRLILNTNNTFLIDKKSSSVFMVKGHGGQVQQKTVTSNLETIKTPLFFGQNLQVGISLGSALKV